MTHHPPNERTHLPQPAGRTRPDHAGVAPPVPVHEPTTMTPPNGNVSELIQLNHANPHHAALAYARNGWPVFPTAGIVAGHCGCRAASACANPGKHPLNHHGLRGASTDPDQLWQWWQTWPWAGVAIRTGAASGLVVVDIDPQHGGTLTLHRLSMDDKLPPTTLATLSVSTGGGGWHLMFAHPGVNIPNTTSRLPALGDTPGIDLRGDGGYIVAPPSPHHSGRRYQWDQTAQPILELPTWARPAPPPTTRWSSPMGPITEGRLARYSQAALQAEANAVASATEGQRNHILNRAAFKLGTLVGAGALQRTAVEALLADAAQAAGLTQTEIARTIHSGLDSGIACPRPLLPTTSCHNVGEGTHLSAVTSRGIQPGPQ